MLQVQTLEGGSKEKRILEEGDLGGHDPETGRSTIQREEVIKAATAISCLLLDENLKWQKKKAKVRFWTLLISELECSRQTLVPKLT